LLCNHFNRDLAVGGITYDSTRVEFSTLVPKDVTFLQYIVAGVLALTVQLSGGVNTAVAIAREFEERTVKELVMGSSLASVVTGKMLTGVAETCIVFGLVLAFVRVAYGFAPACGYVPAILLGVYGIICFSGIGFLAASVIRRTVPSALSMILLNMICWWVGGGLVPGELWSGRLIGYVGSVLPGTYFYRSYTSLALTATTHTLWFDVAVVTVFGLLVSVAAVLRFRREATRI
ncbi:ABC transporter permease, partial [Candidatus Bathyarchaeota archaeon]|nr:ABC transporter permease [Candidatus Bathyarchaeota archaeon]